MNRIRIDGTDLEVSRLCYGQVNLGVKPDEVEGGRLLDIFADLGGNFVDTASVYSDWVPGERHRSERILGDYFITSSLTVRRYGMMQEETILGPV